MARLESMICPLGGLLVLAGALAHTFTPRTAVWLYCAGAVMFSVSLFFDRYDGGNVTIKRLRGQQVLGAIFLLLSAVLMYAEEFRPEILSNTHLQGTLRTLLVSITARNNWIVFMCIAALFELYSSVRMDMELKKEQEDRS